MSRTQEISPPYQELSFWGRYWRRVRSRGVTSNICSGCFNRRIGASERYCSSECAATSDGMD